MPLTIDEPAHTEAVPVDGSFRGLEFGFLPEIDQATMSARFRICTARKDREGDIIEPSGVDWSDYQFAPVVKYEHGFTGIPWPIARSADEAGNLHEEYDADEDAIYARAFFSEKNELSAQCFGLVVEGFLRGSSIHVLPVDGQFKKLADGTHVFYSSQLEWSVATVGVNPDAYVKCLGSDCKLGEILSLQLEAANKILHVGSVGDRKLLPSLAKCLKSFQPPRQSQVGGSSITSEEFMAKKLTKSEVDKLNTVEFVKALGNRSEYDDSTNKILTARAKSFDALPKMSDELEDSYAKAGDDEEGDSLAKADVDEDPIGDPVDEVGAEPTDGISEESTEEAAAPPTSPGVEFLSAIHASLTEVLSRVEAAESTTEKPEVIELASQVAEQLRDLQVTVEGGFGSIYPDQTPLTSSEETADLEMVKAWVAEKSTRRFQLAALANRLGQAVKNPAKAKALISRTQRDLLLLDSQAKSWKPAPKADEGVSSEEYGELLAKVNKLVEQLAKQPAQI